MTCLSIYFSCRKEAASSSVKQCFRYSLESQDNTPVPLFFCQVAREGRNRRGGIDLYGRQHEKSRQQTSGLAELGRCLLPDLSCVLSFPYYLFLIVFVLLQPLLLPLRPTSSGRCLHMPFDSPSSQMSCSTFLRTCQPGWEMRQMPVGRQSCQALLEPRYLR
jgi:hypothetical protein